MKLIRAEAKLVQRSPIRGRIEFSPHTRNEVFPGMKIDLVSRGATIGRAG